MLIFQDALPRIKTFLKHVPLKRRARGLLIRCLIAFLMHLGKMSAAQAAGALRTDARHRAQICRFLGRRYWRKIDLLGSLCTDLLELEVRRGMFLFAVDQTYCGQQGQKTENTFSRGNTKARPKKSQRKQKKSARRSCHCFVMGLLITPSGIRLPFWRPYYTKDYCEQNELDYHTQTELAAELIGQLPLPPKTRVVVLGDTAFEAKSIRDACKEQGYTWIVPLNPERVLAGPKPRPKVKSLVSSLKADQLVRIEVHPARGKYVAYRRIAQCRLGPKLNARTYYVHQESRDVHSVGKVRLVFSTTKAPAKSQPVDVQKILMTNDESLSVAEVIELYQLRWQIELFFKELKSTLGLHHYRFRQFSRVEAWVTLVLTTFVYLEWLRAQKLKRKTLSASQRRWWESQRTYGLACAVRQSAERKELDDLGKALETPGGRRRLQKQLKDAHPKEYRAVI